MSEMIDKLKQLTPKGPDRDAVLIAMGRASAKPSNVWKWLCGGLVLSQMLILVFMQQPKPITENRYQAPMPIPPVVIENEPPSSPPEPGSYLMLMTQAGLDRDPFPRDVASGLPIRESQALTAGSRQLNID